MRRWFSNKDENLLFSFLIKDSELVNKYSYISLAVADTVLKEIEKLGISNVSIKWPNDVFINDSKVCGILLEGNIPSYLIVGVGINVNETSFNDEYRITPTSLKIALGRETNINEFKMNLFNELEKTLLKLKENDFSYLKNVRKHNYLKGKKALISSYSNEKEVKIIDILENNSLLIEDGNKQIEISSGEVFSFKD